MTGTDQDDQADDLDRRLRALLADDGLTLPIAEGTDRSVLAGARRRRRNRTVLASAAGAVAVTVAVFAGVAIAGLGRPAAIAPAAPGPVLATTVPSTQVPSPTTTSPAAVPTPATTSVGAPGVVFGPIGVGRLRIGMSAQQALASGDLDLAGPQAAGGCTVYHSAPVPGRPAWPTTSPVRPSPAVGPATVTPTAQPTGVASGGYDVEVSDRYGVTRLIAGPGLVTPGGVRIGSSRRALLGAYPTLRLTAAGTSATVPAAAGIQYVFQLGAGGAVTSIALVGTGPADCAG